MIKRRVQQCRVRHHFQKQKIFAMKSHCVWSRAEDSIQESSSILHPCADSALRTPCSPRTSRRPRHAVGPPRADHPRPTRRLRPLRGERRPRLLVGEWERRWKRGEETGGGRVFRVAGWLIGVFQFLRVFPLKWMSELAETESRELNELLRGPPSFNADPCPPPIHLSHLRSSVREVPFDAPRHVRSNQMTGPRSAAAPRLSVLFGLWPSSNAEHRRWLWCIVFFSPTETPVATGAMIGDPHSVLGRAPGSGSVRAGRRARAPTLRVARGDVRLLEPPKDVGLNGSG